MFDIIIQNALIYDGTGEPAYLGNVAIQDGKIAAVSKEPLSGAAKIVDAKGLALAPGFVDVHSHSDYCLYKDPHRLHILQMGVTTEISGQCGNSISPASPNMTEQTREYLRSRNSPLFETMEEHLEALNAWELGPNQLHFTGHGMLRGGAMELRADRANEDEIAHMQEALKKAISQGSAGFSTGLSYVPGIYSDSHELIELAKAAAEAGENLGNPGEFTMLELADLVLEMTNSSSKISYKPLPSDDPTRRKADISLAKRELSGWEPKIALREGLEKSIAYFKELV